MDRILILMAAAEYADAQPALDSARNAAAHPEALSFGLSLEYEPEGESLDALNTKDTFFVCPQEDLWAEMDRFWSGESYVLMAHPAMRFTAGWDKALIRALRSCPSGPVMTCALTGFLPVREDPLGEVCPVAAGEFTEEGALAFRHGMPLRYYKLPVRGPFLNPEFCFAPAGFFRAMKEGEEPLFMRAYRAGWELYTLHKPLIRLLWQAPLEPVFIPAGHDLQGDFAKLYGVSFAGRTLSPQARRGLLSAKIEDVKRVSFRLRWRESWRKTKCNLQTRFQRHAKKILPRCVTFFSPTMTDESLEWLRRLAKLQNLPLCAYAEPLLKRHLLEFMPDVYDFHAHHGMEIPGADPEALEPLSKAALLAAARDKFLGPSHYIWMDPDCVRYPVYEGAFLDWQGICQDKVVMAMVAGQPDTSLFAVPENRVLDLANDLHARALAILNQRGALPSEQELWDLTIRENPDWFTFVVLPVRGQLFTRICDA